VLTSSYSEVGAYIQNCDKTIEECYHLFESNPDILLRYQEHYRGNLGEMRMTVIAGWGELFRCLDIYYHDVADFLLLLCQYDPSFIPDSLFLKGCNPQPKYGLDGELCMMALEMKGVSKQMIALLSNPIKYDEAMQALYSFSLV
jgi:hypothetical protein